MEWIGALVFAVAAYGAGILAYTLTANLQPQPEYATVVSDGIRAIGVLITIAGLILGSIMAWYAVTGYFGW